MTIVAFEKEASFERLKLSLGKRLYESTEVLDKKRHIISINNLINLYSAIIYKNILMRFT